MSKKSKGKWRTAATAPHPAGIARSTHLRRARRATSVGEPFNMSPVHLHVLLDAVVHVIHMSVALAALLR